MQKKPEGESRIPTDIWAGMGFSKSMPESAIRDKLGQMGISARVTDNSLESGYEVFIPSYFLFCLNQLLTFPHLGFFFLINFFLFLNLNHTGRKHFSIEYLSVCDEKFVYEYRKTFIYTIHSSFCYFTIACRSYNFHSYFFHDIYFRD